MLGWLIPLAIFVVVILWLVASYNRLVAFRENVRAAWAQIEVLLKRRHDLIPNLVETVKGYAAHEKGTLEAVIAARNAAISTTQGPGGGDPAKQMAAENQLTGAVRQLFALSESYPQLKADTGFVNLQNELTGTENRIAASRSGYNNAVQQYNTSLQSIPTNFIAGMFGFKSEPFFEVTDAAERAVPKVQF